MEWKSLRLIFALKAKDSISSAEQISIDTTGIVFDHVVNDILSSVAINFNSKLKNNHDLT